MSSSKRPHACKDICHAQGLLRPAEVIEGTKQVPSADWVTHRPRASVPFTAVGARGTQTRSHSYALAGASVFAAPLKTPRLSLADRVVKSSKKQQHLPKPGVPS